MTDSGQVLTRLKKTTYLGSHPQLSGQRPKTTVTFFVGGFQADAGKATLASLRWDEVLELQAEDRESLESRVTGPRFLALGFLSLLAPKKTTVSYLRVTDSEGDWIFAVPDLTSMELGGGLRPLQQWITTKASPPSGAVTEGSDVAARLSRLQGLYDSGLITSDEYTRQRAEILRSI